MGNHASTILLLIFSVFIYGCGDCVQIAKAKVLDATTNNPIDSVVIYKESSPEMKVMTDINGRFELRGISGGLFNCPTMKVVLEKTGYETKSLEVGEDTATVIYLKKKL